MRVTLLAIGSRGDVQPLLAFGDGLAEAGHQVRAAAYPRFESQVAAVGLEFAPLAEGRVSMGHSTVEGRRWLEHGSRRWPAWVAFVQDARTVARERLRDALAACADAEVIVASELAILLGWQASEHLGIPLVRARLGPPERIAQSPAAGAVRQAAWIAAQPWLRSLRRQAGLPPPPLREPLGRLGMLELCAYSPAVMGPPARSGASTHVTGYWFLDAAFDPDPPAALVEFLDDGDPPVCVGFGSMLDSDPAALTGLAVESLRRAGRRGVLVGAQYSDGGGALPDTVMAVESVDYRWLLERCEAAVHHGGAGTTAAVLRAGLPSVVVPHMLEQHAWARRIHELGAGPPPLPRRRLSPELLGGAIAEAIRDQRFRERAAALGQRIRREDGIASAVGTFESHLGQPGGRTAVTTNA